MRHMDKDDQDRVISALNQLQVEMKWLDSPDLLKTPAQEEAVFLTNLWIESAKEELTNLPEPEPNQETQSEFRQRTGKESV